MHEITLEYLLTHHFEKTGSEYYSDSKQKASMRSAPNQLSQLPHNDSEKMADLKIEMMNIFLEVPLINIQKTNGSTKTAPVLYYYQVLNHRNITLINVL